MGIVDRLNRLDSKLGLRRPDETDEMWLYRMSQIRFGGGYWSVLRTLAAVVTKQSAHIAALEARVAQLERERG